ncbi:hypothetical protein KK141_15725 [Dyella sp. LX-66]|uniref:hypothetical protein n=1 Tax=unclassified Dyella TaxID=2634549 RepID=UPI001BDFC882|nr:MULTISPECIES: hypothetical protein [unclassified Dyella]MBT2118091.1 hypothetical protein [Dyella sp. LX-1]MBT2140998.1 hypothetical protein [Dyella sp. LX-66]
MTPVSTRVTRSASRAAAAASTGGMTPMGAPPTRPTPLSPMPLSPMMGPPASTPRPATVVASSSLAPLLPGPPPPRAPLLATPGGTSATPHSTAPASSPSALSPMLLTPSATPTLSPMVSPYSAAHDRTLTAAQASSGGFRPLGTDKVVRARPIDESEFRFPSNPTTSGHSSGYHEAFAPTDTMRFLSRRSVHSDGTATLPSWSSNTVLPSYSGTRIHEENVRHVAEASDGARTDTAQTVLSVPGGGVAGHTGSGVRTSGQAAGHDYLRHQTMRALQTPGVTSGVAGVLAGATTIMSMAPGQSASGADGAGSLKDSSASGGWEERRNSAKRALDTHFTTLPPAQQSTVMKLARHSMSDLDDGSRHLLPDRPYSPFRDPLGTSGAAMSGGGYMPTLSAPTPSPSAFPVLSTGGSPGALLAPVARRPTASGAASSSVAPASSGTLAPRPASVPGTPATPASGTALGAREIAMDITSAFRSDRRTK